MKRKLTVAVVLALLVTGCAAGRAFRKGEEAIRNGNWDEAVTEFTKAVQEKPGRAEYKIALERATQTASREHISRAQELESKDQLDCALLEYRGRWRWTRPNRLAAARAAELEQIIRDRIEATRPKPAIDRDARGGAARPSTPLLSPTAPLPVISFSQLQPARHPQLHRRADRHQRQFDGSLSGQAPVTVRLEDVTIEQALQQVCRPTGTSTRSSTRSTIIVVPDNAQKHAQYDELVVRVFYLSHADADRDRADPQHDHADSADAGAAGAASRTRPPTRSPCAARRRWSTSSSR